MEFNARPNLVQLAFQTQKCIVVTEPSLDLHSKFNERRIEKNKRRSIKHRTNRLIDRRSRGREDLLLLLFVNQAVISGVVISGHNASSNITFWQFQNLI